MSGDVTQISIPKCYPPSISRDQAGPYVDYTGIPLIGTGFAKFLILIHEFSRNTAPFFFQPRLKTGNTARNLVRDRAGIRCITQRKILHEIADLKQSLFVLSGKRPCSEMRVLRYAASLMACTRICFGLPDLVGINSEGNALIEMAANLPLLQRLTGAYFMRQFMLTLLHIFKFTN